MSDLSQVLLGEICELKAGNAFPKERQGVSTGELPFIKVSDFELPGNERRITKANNYLSTAAAQELKVKRHRAGGVAFAKIGIALTYNRRRLLTMETAVDNNLMVAEAINARCDDLYFYYLLKTVDFNLIANGSALPYLNASDIRSIEVSIHPRNEQVAIAQILGTLDDKIELNRKTNETLEAMAKALFKSWFVDFDPVRAKVEGRSTGLPAEISDLFPDSFEDSELGEIPSGWSIGTIGNAVGEVFDGPHATPKEASDGYVFLGIKNMTGTSLDLSEKRWIGLDDWDQWTKRVLPTRGDIVFTYEAALGLFAVIPPDLTCCLGRRMALIRPRGNEPTPYFWFHQFTAEPFQRLIEERSVHGATVNRTPLTEFPQYPVLDAPAGIRNLFETTASALWSRIHLGSNEIEELGSTRDALLPKLISGEIRIPDAERMLEEVGV
jgi:type I restriction enzyme S subunit